MTRSRITTQTANKKDDPASKSKDEQSRSSIQEYLAEIGRKGGLKGGKARAATLSSRKRSAIAKKAAETRWRKKK